MVGRVREEPLGRRRQRRRIKKISSKVYGRSVDDPLDAHGDTLGELCLSSVYPANACTVVAAKRVCRGTKRGAALGPTTSVASGRKPTIILPPPLCAVAICSRLSGTASGPKLAPDSVSGTVLR